MNKKLSVLIAVASCSTLAPFAIAGGDRLEVIASVFVGKAGDCGTGYPAGSHLVTSKWLKGIGLPDNGGPNVNSGDPRDNPNKKDPHFGLLLSKNGPTPDCSSAGAKIRRVKGIALTEIGFDIRNGTHCGAGAPRFNVLATDSPNVHFLGGCSNGTQTAAPQDPAWTRVRIDPSNPAQAFPPIAAGATIKSIEIVFDEGTDEVPGAGLAVIDNIDINGKLVGAREDDDD
jgi:hypothetical protein